MDHYSLIDQISLLCKSKLSQLPNDSLFEGKLGVAIFLFHYSKFIKNKEVYVDAYKLLEEIWNNLETNTSVPGFKYGISGIAFGIDYLYRNNFLPQFDPSLLVELDQYIFERKSHQLDIIYQDECCLGQQIYFLNRYKVYLQQNDVQHRHFLSLVLIQFIDDCQELVVSKNFISGRIFHLPFISAFVYFLTEAHQLNINQTKTSNIIYKLFNRILDQISSSQTINESILLCKLAAKLQPFAPQGEHHYYESKFSSHETLSVDLKILSQHAREVLILNSFCSPFLFCSSNLDKDIVQIDLNSLKLSLDEGLAGIGLGLIDILNLKHLKKTNG